ncbi:MAG: hypothetical protein WBA74_07135 [Cyclobacteriaceae bacterium]
MDITAHPQLIRQMMIKDLSLDDEEASGLQIDDDAKLIENFRRLISYLLDHDLNRLINACYRMDVPQEKFQFALNSPDPEQVPAAVADLILKRELEKIKWREKYKNI